MLLFVSDCTIVLYSINSYIYACSPITYHSMLWHNAVINYSFISIAVYKSSASSNMLLTAYDFHEKCSTNTEHLSFFNTWRQVSLNIFYTFFKCYNSNKKHEFEFLRSSIRQKYLRKRTSWEKVSENRDRFYHSSIPTILARISLFLNVRWNLDSNNTTTFSQNLYRKIYDSTAHINYLYLISKSIFSATWIN